MPRPVGIRNQDYDEKRLALVDAMLEYVEQPSTTLPSLRQLAIAAKVSDAALRHYFGDRRGVIVALIERIKEKTDGLRQGLQLPATSIEAAVTDYIAVAAQLGEDATYLRWHVFALREGMLDPEVFLEYERLLYHPAIDAVASRFYESPGGPDVYEAAQHGAELLISAAMAMALRNHFRSPDDEGGDSQADLKSRFNRLRNWALHGVVHDPNGLGEPQDASDP
ncbi:TetR/AcrR family transcriptional regulator [Henriciella litoralis]|uniref:TetR/AcrR family transcriptional regulator n=1 Tax=Henriciella litoralis TaxID=568102 RepID=UPI000A003E94|nr:TetR/AcrR family transcriptional regulator [Henriciella litoralis]